MNPYRLALGAVAILGAANPAPAQHVSPLIKYGKWAVLGASLAMNIEAARAHNQADDAFRRLERYCLGAQFRCATSGSGGYLDPVSEGYYQESLRHDRQSRRWLVGGETALLGAVTLFVWELTRPRGPPDNIPFSPEVKTVNGRTRVGVRVAF